MSEPERPIEKLLRGCAREGRDRAGQSWELHPVNRRQLQKEVESTFGSGTKQRPGFSSWFGSFGWFKLTGAIAALAILGTAIWLILTSAEPKRDATLVARNEPAIAQNDKAEAASTLDSKSEGSGPRMLQERELALQPPAEQNSLTKKDQGAERPMGDRVEKEGKVISAPALAEAAPQQTQPTTSNEIPAPPPAASVNPQTAEELASSAFRKRYGFARGLAQQTAPVAPANPTSNAGKQQEAVDLAVATAAPSGQATAFDVTRNIDAEALKRSSNQTIQYGYFSSTQNLGRQLRSFQQDNRNGTATSKRAVSPKASPGSVLTYFRLEQSGNELRVLDGDNSIYSGTIKPAAVQATYADYQDGLRAKSSPLTVPQPDAAKSVTFQATQQQATRQDYVFQVVGTNLSLKQRVVFSGILRPGATTAGVLFRDDASAGPSAGSAQGFTSPSPTPQSHYISGTALIGSARQIDIEATPVPAQPAAR